MRVKKGTVYSEDFRDTIPIISNAKYVMIRKYICTICLFSYVAQD